MHITRRQFASLALAPALAALGGCIRPSPVFQGINLTNASYRGDFALTDATGHTHRLSDFRGRYLMLFFGYTQCPDVCPTALSRAVAIRTLLGEQKDRLQVAFISVDPERDRPDIASAYARAFDPSFVGIAGEPAQTAQAAQNYRVFYRKVPTGSSYSIDHTALSYVVDPEGRVRLALMHAQTAGQCADDLRKLMRHDADRKGGWA